MKYIHDNLVKHLKSVDERIEGYIMLLDDNIVITGTGQFLFKSKKQALNMFETSIGWYVAQWDSLANADGLIYRERVNRYKAEHNFRILPYKIGINLNKAMAWAAKEDAEKLNKKNKKKKSCY